MNLDEVLAEMIQREGSDLHIKSGRPPLIRISGELLPTERDVLTGKEIYDALAGIMAEKVLKGFDETKDADFSYSLAGQGRFRVNAFVQQGEVGAVFRFIPVDIPTIDQLGLPAVLKDICSKHQGLVLVTGPTGSGKSTSLAAMVNHINESRAAHIMTIEDPIEFVYTDKTATINQREVGKDTGDFTMALRAALRQDPDVILMGEMRDIETIDIALHAAETGHLVFSTLHTNDAAQTMDRIKNTFPAEAQSHIQEMLALCLVGVVSQRLVPKADGTGRVAAIEVMVNSPAIAELIEKGEIGKIIQAMKKAGAYYRMQTMNQALAAFVQADVITEEVAAATSQTPDDLRLILKGFSGGGTTVGSSVKTEVAKAEDKDEKPAEEEKKDAEPKEEGDDKRKFKIKRGF